jgi:hypothetical protein
VNSRPQLPASHHVVLEPSPTPFTRPRQPSRAAPQPPRMPPRTLPPATFWKKRRIRRHRRGPRRELKIRVAAVELAGMILLVSESSGFESRRHVPYTCRWSIPTSTSSWSSTAGSRWAPAAHLYFCHCSRSLTEPLHLPRLDTPDASVARVMEASGQCDSSLLFHFRF